MIKSRFVYLIKRELLKIFIGYDENTNLIINIGDSWNSWIVRGTL